MRYDYPSSQEDDPKKYEQIERVRTKKNNTSKQRNKVEEKEKKLLIAVVEIHENEKIYRNN